MLWWNTANRRSDHTWRGSGVRSSRGIPHPVVVRRFGGRCESGSSAWNTSDRIVKALARAAILLGFLGFGGAENLIKEANKDAGLAAHPSGRFDVNSNHF